MKYSGPAVAEFRILYLRVYDDDVSWKNLEF